MLKIFLDYSKDGADFWENLADLLNQMNGAVKSGLQWKRCWNDQKYFMRKSSRQDGTKAPDEEVIEGTRSFVTMSQKSKMLEYLEMNEDL